MKTINNNTRKASRYISVALFAVILSLNFVSAQTATGQSIKDLKKDVMIASASGLNGGLPVNISNAVEELTIEDWMIADTKSDVTTPVITIPAAGLAEEQFEMESWMVESDWNVAPQNEKAEMESLMANEDWKN